jgi:hypothetical protein
MLSPTGVSGKELSPGIVGVCNDESPGRVGVSAIESSPGTVGVWTESAATTEYPERSISEMVKHAALAVYLVEDGFQARFFL